MASAYEQNPTVSSSNYTAMPYQQPPTQQQQQSYQNYGSSQPQSTQPYNSLSRGYTYESSYHNSTADTTPMPSSASDPQSQQYQMQQQQYAGYQYNQTPGSYPNSQSYYQYSAQSQPPPAPATSQQVGAPPPPPTGQPSQTTQPPPPGYNHSYYYPPSQPGGQPGQYYRYESYPYMHPPYDPNGYMPVTVAVAGAGVLNPSLGQIQPAGMRPKITTTMWEDEKTLCYQVEANGATVVRRADNDMINGTKLLNVAKMTRGRRDGILKAEKTRHVVKIGSMHLKGVWIPFERALAMAQRESIVDMLYPIFVKDIKKVIQQGTPTTASSMKQGSYYQPQPTLVVNEIVNVSKQEKSIGAAKKKHSPSSKPKPELDGNSSDIAPTPRPLSANPSSSTLSSNTLISENSGAPNNGSSYPSYYPQSQPHSQYQQHYYSNGYNNNSNNNSNTSTSNSSYGQPQQQLSTSTNTPPSTKQHQALPRPPQQHYQGYATTGSHSYQGGYSNLSSNTTGGYSYPNSAPGANTSATPELQ